MSAQLVLPFSPSVRLQREDFIVAPCNAQAVAFIDSWPHWPVAVAALYGPSGSGKTHLASAWQSASGARRVQASALGHDVGTDLPVVVEDVDSSEPTAGRDAQLFRLMDAATTRHPVLLTGQEAPLGWASHLPDLASRFGAVLGLPLWAADEALLHGLARKLLDDRQMPAPDTVVALMVRALERNPSAIRDFIEKVDAKALAEGRPVSAVLVRSLLAENDALS